MEAILIGEDKRKRMLANFGYQDVRKAITSEDMSGKKQAKTTVKENKLFNGKREITSTSKQKDGTITGFHPNGEKSTYVKDDPDYKIVHDWHKSKNKVEKSDEDTLEKAEKAKPFGQTKSGKPFYSNFDHPSHKSFTKKDHGDAGEAHGRAVIKLDNALQQSKDKKLTSRIQTAQKFHNEQRTKHFDAYDSFKKSNEDELEKAGKKTGEGSHGGKIIGHTRSGKPIYQKHHPAHKAYKSYTAEDHEDAGDAHFGHVKKMFTKTKAGVDRSKDYKHHHETGTHHYMIADRMNDEHVTKAKGHIDRIVNEFENDEKPRVANYRKFDKIIKEHLPDFKYEDHVAATGGEHFDTTSNNIHTALQKNKKTNWGKLANDLATTFPEKKSKK